MVESQRATPQGVFVPLESLRGLAALIVVVYHAQWTNPVGSLRFFANGALMVDFFFVLSGFVIFHSYGSRLGTRPAFLRFLWLRIGRLYPLHLVTLLVFLAFEIAKWVGEKRFDLAFSTPAFAVNDAYALVTNLLLIQSLHLHNAETYNFPSWSVSTEFYAYVLFAAVRSICTEDREFNSAAVLIFVMAAATLFCVNAGPLTNALHDWGYLRCVAGFFLGTLTYQSYITTRARLPDVAAPGPYAWLSPLALLATIAWLSTVDPASRWTYTFPVLPAVVIWSLVLWPQRALQSLLTANWLTWLGRISYSLYMVHAAVASVIHRVLTMFLKFPVAGDRVALSPVAGSLMLMGYVAVVLALSHVTYRWIERPFRERSRQAAKRWFTGGLQQAPRRPPGSEQRNASGLGPA